MVIGPALPQGRGRTRGVSDGVDDGPSIRSRAPSRRTAERNGPVAVGLSECSVRRRVRRGVQPERTSPGGQGALAPRDRRGHERSVEMHRGCYGHDRDRGRAGSDGLDDDLERRLLDRCEVELVGARAASRTEAVPPWSEAHQPARAGSGHLGHLDVRVRCGCRQPRFGVDDRADHQADVIQRRRRINCATVDDGEPGNRLTGDCGQHVTERAGAGVGADRHVGITMGCAHDDVHRPEHYGTAQPSGDVSTTRATDGEVSLQLERQGADEQT